MSAWEYERLAAEAQSGQLRPAYLLAGPDAFQKRALLQAIRTGLRATGRGVHEVDLEGQAVTPEGVVVEARTADLLGRRLIVVDDPPWILPSREDSVAGANDDASTVTAKGSRKHRSSATGNALTRYLASPNPDSVFVLRSEEVPDARQAAVRAIKAHGAVLAATCKGCERELAGWCQRRAREGYRIRLAPDAERLLTWRCPPDLGALDQELAKLAVAATGAEVTAEMVQALTPTSREERVRSVVTAVAERRARDALSSLRHVLDQGQNPGVGVLALLAGQVRELAAARRAVQERKTAAGYAKECGIDPWRVERLHAQAAHFRRASEFADVLETLWGAGTAIRTGWAEAAGAAETALALAAGRVRWAGPSVEEMT